TNSPVLVTNIMGPIQKVTVSLYLTHTFDGDLTLQLIGPDGTTATLSQNNGGSGDNYGLNCAPDAFRTTFDDDAANYVYYGRPPFVGSFKPEQPLANFIGKAGTNANGIWQLHVMDSFGMDVGVLQCWSLFITSRSCTDGGGLCPGVDLSVGMNDLPDPATVGSNLVYTITVTNHGPAVAKGVVVTHTLPDSVQFVSAAPSQGGASYSGGVVTCTLGSLAVGGTATIAVTVMPTAAGNIFSSANVASTDPELNSADNSVAISTVVVPPVADLSVGIAAFPNPAIVGETLTYTFAVTNNGPATATGVTMSNTLPPSVRINTVDYSQGTISVAGNTIVCNVGLLGKNASATATVNVTALDYGTIYASSRVSALQTDPLLANNSFTAATTVGQSADVALTMTARPDPVVVSSNLTYVITVTNRGPNTATNVVVTQVLPTGVAVVSTTLSQGTSTQTGSTLVCKVGTLVVGAKATVTVVVSTTRIGNLSSTASVTAAQNDPNSANNSAAATSQVSTPFINIVPAGATLTYESLAPANGALDAGETNTIQFRLQNIGNVPNTNLVATLVASGGIVPLSGTQNYGTLKPVGVPGGVPVSRPFTFKTTASAGGTVVVTLQLQDGSSNLPPAQFTFPLPNVATFANTNAITIPDLGMATNYPAVITVSGMTGQVSRVTASISGFTHTYPHDVSVLLVSPTGVKTLLMSHAADMSSANGVDLTFDDRAATALPAIGEVSAGAWQPTVYPPTVAFSNPAPAGPYSVTL
ncbi:MAG TPA: proprotein convertase P-domain-containing protein, partial [Candidatus Sulfotelmatobacter sp.]|nr:proprotein convertase P-domain-containing protein [Candidatus Sulfotelmatobacter sp.]